MVGSRTVALSLALGVALIACGESETSRAPLPAGDTAFPLYPAFCHFLARCKPELLSLFPSDSLEGCLAHAACSADSASRIRLALTDPAACLHFVETAACDELEANYRPTTLTSFALSGVVFGADDVCAFDYESSLNGASAGETCLTLSETDGCANGLYCAPSSPRRLAGSSHCGVCEARVGSGAACDNELPCIADHRCIDGRCRLLLEDGEACETNEQCRFRTCTAGQCTMRVDDAPPPLPDAAELLGLACDPLDVNDPCNDHFALACVDNVCVPRADLGERCNPDTFSCRTGQVCAEGICVEVGCTNDVGEACQGDICAFRSACDQVTHRCLPEPGLGEPCVIGCREPYICDMSSELCVERLPIGAGCWSGWGWECSTGFCDRDYAPYCEPESCTIPTCDEECGVCAEPPTRADCEED